MKIAILSDTHDNTPAIVWAIEYLNKNKIDVALHAGDMINPGILHRFRDHYNGHLHFVFGNNDGEQALAERRANLADNLTCHLQEMRETFEGVSIFMNHYSSISESIAKSGDYDISIGGHDHEFRISTYEDSTLYQPWKHGHQR